MKFIAVTGHTKRIGKAIYEAFPETTVVGLSRSNRYDINNLNGRTRIIHRVANCDVFINNAFHGMAQMTLLNKFWDLWKYDETKTIVNISSLSKYPGLSGNENGYSALKAALSHQAFLLMFSNKERKCRMINVNPGYVDTEMTAHIDQNINMLTPEECAGPIAYAINQPQHIEIGELGIWRPFC